MAALHTVDARGLTCPQPVLETKRALEEGGHKDFLVLVDNHGSRENVARFAQNQGCHVDIVERPHEQFELRIVCSGPLKQAEQLEEISRCAVPAPSLGKGIVVYVGSNSMGRGDPELGEKLMRGFLRTWIDVQPRQWRMIFINSGVKLTTIDDEAVEAISMLEEKGVEVLSCGTCLQHYGLDDGPQVGRVTSMYEVIESLNAAEKVVSPD